jgi:Fungal chitosanase of glycosyl hydrolase group 75
MTARRLETLPLLGILLLLPVACGGGGGAPVTTGDGTGSGGSSSGPPTASELLAKMASCSQISNGTYATDAGGPHTVAVCGANGAVWWKADMDIDCDGVTTAECNLRTDPAYQDGTSLEVSTGGPFNAATMPYVVIPNRSSRFSYSASGISLGAAVAVIYSGKVEYGVFADTGPADIIGEASYAMGKALGIDPDPSTGGVDSGVTYLIFPGSRVSPVESHSAAVALGQELARRFVDGN